MEDNPTTNYQNQQAADHSPLLKSFPNQGTPITAQHYLAEIKYPNIPEPITIDKIFNVLQKIRTTSKPLFYKWQPLNRPKHGEIFLEQKYPLTSDPISGDQFSIFDDGYLWSSIPKPEVQEYQGQPIEIFKWNEGFCQGDKFFSMTKTEYRLKSPNNILFLIHYMEIKGSNSPVRAALPATKISPMYLQQQFFQHLKQQMAQISSLKRSNSPVTVNPIRPSQSNKIASKLPQNKSPIGNNSSNVNNQQRPSQQAQTSSTSANVNDLAANEASLDIFDSFSDFESAFYRLNSIKPFFNLLFESSISSQSKHSTLSTELEQDLVAATRKKISSIHEKLENYKKTQTESLQKFKTTQSTFWDTLNQLESSSNPDIIFNQYMNSQKNSMDQELESSFTSL